MQQDFITKEEIDQIRPYLSNVDEVLSAPVDDFLIALDDAIIGQLGDNYESTPVSRMLQDIYDSVLERADDDNN